MYIPLSFIKTLNRFFSIKAIHFSHDDNGFPGGINNGKRMDADLVSCWAFDRPEWDGDGSDRGEAKSRQECDDPLFRAARFRVSILGSLQLLATDRVSRSLGRRSRCWWIFNGCGGVCVLVILIPVKESIMSHT